MSLISDALKTAQRERGRSQATKDPQQLVEGFFPYAPSARPRSRSKVVPIAAVSVAVVALLAVTAWLVLAKPSRPAPGARVPIVLPPPVTIAQTPPRVDSALKGAAASVKIVDPVPTANTSPAPGNSVVSTQQQRASEARGKPAEVVRTSETPGTSSTIEPVAGGIPRPPGRVSDATVPRIDYEAKATALFNAGDLDGARENFELATRFAPTARAWTNYGVTLQRLGDYPGASSAYRAAVGVDANYLEAWLYQARLASEMKDVAKAVPLLQRALAINPHSPDVNIELARLEADAKNWTETRKFAEEAIRSDPTNARGQWYFAVASDQLKDGDAAIRGYTAYLQYVGAAERDQAQFVGWARTRLTELRGKP